MTFFSYNNLSESMKFFEAMDPPPECPEAGFNLYQMQDGRLPILNRVSKLVNWWWGDYMWG